MQALDHAEPRNGTNRLKVTTYLYELISDVCGRAQLDEL